MKQEAPSELRSVGVVHKGQEYPIPLQVHHINGDRKDHRIENLEILCPTCHALTDNYAGKNIKRVKKPKEPYHPKPRPTKRPPKDQLLEDYREYGGYLGIGRKYSVSDNAVKKWFAYYSLPTKVKEIRALIIQKFGKQEHWYAYRRTANFDRVIEKIGKPIIMTDKNSQTTEFRSIAEASRITGIHEYTIARMCKGLQTRIRGISFQYKNTSPLQK